MTIEVELSDELARAFAEFLKRGGYSDYRQLAASEQEAYAMRDAGEKGIAPR